MLITKRISFNLKKTFVVIIALLISISSLNVSSQEGPGEGESNITAVELEVDVPDLSTPNLEVEYNQSQTSFIASLGPVKSLEEEVFEDYSCKFLLTKLEQKIIIEAQTNSNGVCNLNSEISLQEQNLNLVNTEKSNNQRLENTNIEKEAKLEKQEIWQNFLELEAELEIQGEIEDLTKQKQIQSNVSKVNLKKLSEINSANTDYNQQNQTPLKQFFIQTQTFISNNLNQGTYFWGVIFIISFFLFIIAYFLLIVRKPKKDSEN